MSGINRRKFLGQSVAGLAAVLVPSGAADKKAMAVPADPAARKPDTGGGGPGIPRQTGLAGEEEPASPSVSPAGQESVTVPSAPAEECEAYWELVKRQFPFEDGIYYFNNASLGPSPEAVRDATEAFRRQLDGFPSKYMWGGWSKEKEEVRRKAAALLDASPEEIALIHNTTEGMNVIAASLPLQPGDEAILADHEHPSGVIPWQYWQETRGIKLVRPVLPLLPQTPEEIAAVYEKAITPRTKAILMCHVLNTNGMILPVQQVAGLARERGIRLIVDGAQSAGMFPFSVRDLGCDYYAASAHKWLFSPKGVGLFYARKEAQRDIRPLIAAQGYEDHGIRRFENYNTRNLPEVLGSGSALDFNGLIGPQRIEARIRALKHHFLERIATDPRFAVKTPAAVSLSAGIVTVEVKGKDVAEVEKLLTSRHRINCRPMPSHGLNGLRLSFSIYNTKADVDYLVEALRELTA